MSKPKAAKPAACATPRDMTEASFALQELGAAQRALTLIDARLQEETAALKACAEAEAAPHRERAQQLLDALELYAAANRDALTHHGRTQTAKLPGGVIGWRRRPPAVKLTAKLEVVIASIRNLRMTQFLREKVEIDKDAMLADQVTAGNVPGVKIASAGEMFFAEPAALGLAPDAPPAAA